jgi:hypothetical protein
MNLNVELTRGGNPKPPKEDIICDWVLKAWRKVTLDTIKKSISRAVFCDNYNEWQIARHDIYGERFTNL